MPSFHEYLNEVAKNSDIIQAFVDGKDKGKSRHLFIEKTPHGRNLVNYYTTLVYKPDAEDIYIVNTRKYSVTTSKIQGSIGYKLSGKNVKQVDAKEMEAMRDHYENVEGEPV